MCVGCSYTYEMESVVAEILIGYFMANTFDESTTKAATAAARTVTQREQLRCMFDEFCVDLAPL